MAKRQQKSPANYRAMVKVVRKYAENFDAGAGYDARRVSGWSSSRKAAVTRYYEEILRLTSGPHYVFRTPIKQNLKTIKESTGQSSLPKLKAAIIPTIVSLDQETHKLKAKKPRVSTDPAGFVTIKIGNVERTLLPFSAFGFTQRDFAANPSGVLESVLSATAKRFRSYGVMVGNYFLTAADRSTRVTDASAIRGIINYLVNRYANSGEWVRGLVGFNFKTIKDIRDYRDSERDYKAERAEYTKQIFDAKNKINEREKFIIHVSRYSRVTKKNIRELRGLLTRAINESLDLDRPNMPVIVAASDFRKRMKPGMDFPESVKRVIIAKAKRDIVASENEIKTLIVKRTK
ncbi:MAG: hypothetical protein WC130_10590 [Kiritimatiellia bacterium]